MAFDEIARVRDYAFSLNWDEFPAGGQLDYQVLDPARQVIGSGKVTVVAGAGGGAFDAPLNFNFLRVTPYLQGQAVGWIKERLEWLDVAQGLIGGIVVEPVELRQLREVRVRVGDVVVR